MAETKIEWIDKMLDKGLTVYFSTTYKIFKITKKNRSVLSVKKGSIYMNRVCMDYCKLSAMQEIKL